jgi:diaminopimelate decarboxylase
MKSHENEPQPSSHYAPDQVPEEKRWLRYLNGRLHAEDVALDSIARSVETPFYCYSTSALRRAYADLSKAITPLGVKIHFAVKANSNVHVLAEFARLGCGMDIVSVGELERALAAGVPPARIIFSGVGKKRSEILRALQVGICQINAESAAELETIAAVAESAGLRAPVCLRVNPDIDAGTHAKITTGRNDSKFGIPITEVSSLYTAAAKLPELDVVGVAVHIGSQLLDLTPFRRAWTKMAELVEQLRALGLRVPRLDLGGGLGIGTGVDDGPDIEAYAATIEETVGGLGCALAIEPGRWLAARAGVLVTEVLYVKEAPSTNIAVVDAAMNDLMRPALYDAHHRAFPLVQHSRADASASYRLVGPVCESSDVFGTYDDLGQLAAGDLLLFDDAGAYGASMSSTYNSRDLVPEVMVAGDKFTIIRRRLKTSEILSLECVKPRSI